MQAPSVPFTLLVHTPPNCISYVPKHSVSNSLSDSNSTILSPTLLSHWLLRFTQFLESAHSRSSDALQKPRLLITQVTLSATLIPLRLLLSLVKPTVDLPSPSPNPTQCPSCIFPSPNPRRLDSFKKMRERLTSHSSPTPYLTFLHANHNFCMQSQHLTDPCCSF